MTQTINILPDDLINKIAAGEVIESPKNALKELIENAIDAKAKNIHIEIKNAGLQKILVEDDGVGMNNKDAKLSFLRHATSKINSFDDLINVNSMGFRGEALASIASISNIDLKTSVSDLGSHLKIKNSKVIFEDEIARTKGTTIEINNLFYNVPVRKKFQKTYSYLNSEISKMVTQLTLCYPEVGFSFVLDGKKVLTTSRYTQKKEVAFEKRVKDVLKKEFLLSCKNLYHKEKNLEIFGFIGYPLAAKKTKNSSYLIVNKRSIYSLSLTKVIKEAYSTRISEREYPIFALHINIPASFIDVNVHPQKKEIRFREELFIKEIIKKAISKTLENNYVEESSNEIGFLNSEIEFQKEEEKYSTPVEKENIFQKFEKQLLFENTFDFENRVLDFLQIDNLFILESKYLNDLIEVEEDEKLLIFDLSSIYSSFLFEKLKNKKSISKSQNLLIPIVVDLSSSDILFVESNIKSFSMVGLTLRVVSNNQISIDAAPDILKKEDLKELFLIILEDLKDFQSSSKIKEIALKNLALKISKHAKSKRDFSKSEAIYLIEEMVNNKIAFIDPFGRPSIKKITKDQLLKLFKTL